MAARVYDVIVAGVGVMGAAACRELARRGLRVLGLEQFEPGHDRGSSHGRSRVIRHAYFEDPRYVPMVREAWAAWRELEARSGERLLTQSGCINIGPTDHEAIEGVLRSVEQHGLAAEVLTVRQIAARWPAFKCRDGDIGVYEQEAGILRPEACVAALVREAREAGAAILSGRRLESWSTNDERVSVHTSVGTCEARTLVVAAGAWLPRLGVLRRPPLVVERQVQLWFEPIRPELFKAGVFPVFIHFVDEAAYYGLPSGGAEGVKIARHHGVHETNAEDVDREVRAQDEEDVRGYIRRHLPLAGGRLLDGQVCMYTNTPDQHFIVDRHPERANVLITGGFSGHGFKFAPVIGRILADMAKDQAARGPELFSLARFGS